ncbi:hypothetical protein tb265_48230 [Gemmatimonadetes bacterium T265]|nr:hypothetical protein tb265_48230 [Gemmatimonadetes bacterium T265]
MVVRIACASAACGVPVAPPAAAQAPGAPSCQLLCSPALVLFPALNRSPLAGAPRVQRLSDGSVHRLAATSNFQVTLVGTLQTALPRLGLLGSVQWTPYATEQGNPFTRYSASEVGSTYDRANSPTVSLLATGALVRRRDAGGWADLNLYAGDLYGPAQRPNDRSSYTHKVDAELVADAYPFAALPRATWAHGAAVTLVLDRVLTGLPHAGDEVPRGERRYVDAAHPLTLLAGLSLPLTAAP